MTDSLALVETSSTDDRPIAIEVCDVAKTFRKHSEPAKTLKERLLTLRKSTVEEFHALDGVNFTVGSGETFGILGHNGSGKSTLLKCIAATIRPTKGTVRVRGRLSALLELGAGFHPDLTGRENVYLNGSILGFSRERIDTIFDEIVSFAGLEEFIDTQVKHYSSGMYARLGFAVAVNLEPDVLLVDEVLAVGDEAFQRKCIERVRGFQAAGRTICLVTHSPEMVQNLCDRAMVLDHGKLIYLGDVSGAVAAYRQSLAGNERVQPSEDGSIELVERPSVRFTSVSIDPPPGGAGAFQPGDKVTVITRFDADGEFPIRGHLWVHRHDGLLMVDVSTVDLYGHDMTVDLAGGEIRYVIEDLPFNDGRFQITTALQAPTEDREYDRSQHEVDFEVLTDGSFRGPMILDLRVETSLLTPAPTGS